VACDCLPVAGRVCDGLPHGGWIDAPADAWQRVW